jgi:hypothetical protein
VNAVKDSPINAIAIVPMANASGAACPVACATSVTLNAAVTDGQMMDSDNPTASGKLNREINRPIASPHDERCYIRIRCQAIAQTGLPAYCHLQGIKLWHPLRRAANWR